MSKINKILLALVILLIIILGGVIYWQKGGFKKTYHAVYLSTGDLYFGEVDRFPKLALKNVWLLQKNDDNAQNPYGLLQFNKVFWGPEDKIYLNEKDVIWMSELSDNSPVAKVLNDPQSVEKTQNENTSQTSIDQASTSTEE